LLLHDPIGDLITMAPELVDYLDEQRRLGRIRCWGVTGQPSELGRVTEHLGSAPVTQFRDDIFEKPLASKGKLGEARITYGALARTLPTLRRLLAHAPRALETWSDRLGEDLTTESNLPRMLLSGALRRNKDGLVLFSTTRPERARVAAEAATRSAALSDADMVMFSDFAAAIRLALPEGFEMP
jgi:hypothetical protein